MAIGATTDGREVCRIWLLVDGLKKTCRRRGKDTARKGEEGEKDGGFAGEHLESCWLLAGGWSRLSCECGCGAKGFVRLKKTRQMGKTMSVGAKERLW